MADHQHPVGVPPGWIGRAETELRRAGHHSTVPRSTIITAIGAEDCLVTADELIHRLRDAGRPIGAATVYRTLELLERLRLLRRIEIGDGVARYEPAMPDGEHHHHHYVCLSCGTVTPFEDRDLEEAMVSLARRFDQPVEGHEVILKGTCARCAGHP